LKPEEIILEPSEGYEPSDGLHIDESASTDLQLSEDFTPPSRRKAIPIVLIVEDNRDMRSYLKDCLASDFRIIETVDGEDGLKTAIDKIPDLIISDVMMPQMDGFELCGRLKSDERTSHIPVILLTARASAADKIGGLEFGADDYIIKPFDTKELLVRVKNLIQQRSLLRKKFSQQITFVPDEIATTPVDISFLQKAKNIIEGHIADEDFSVELLAKNIGMSRSQLHRKLRALTDHSTSEFIRTLRLQRAAYLLQQKHLTVTEVAFEVGFNNPSYFAACFRKQFGKLPSEYMTKI
jgi:DNA-binding response OmpR family regulator